MSSMGETHQPGKWGEKDSLKQYLSLAEGRTSEREKEQVNTVWKVEHEHCYQISWKNNLHLSMGGSFKIWGLSEDPRP